MGIWQVSASVLDMRLNVSKAPDSTFQVAGIVTQAPSARARGRKLMPSPVAQHALEKGFPSDLIFMPERAGLETFLADLKDLQLEFCITAAYGNILPSKFLEIPHHGCELLIREQPSTFDGSTKLKAEVQDDSKASLAPKVRAFAGWLGTQAKVQLLDGNDQLYVLQLKIITTRALDHGIIHGKDNDITFKGDALTLEVLEVQLPGKKVVRAREFWNGLQGQRLKILP